ncbi:MULTISPECIES: TPMT family class I SAM-dependent methyltransferase [Flavobacterium]|uniref:TPMT family class I SAM-dependent methyltransferase n=1 Tax=Flavobacterium TaxID=237 RepID=UPI001FCB24B3|nr:MULTISPECIES: TPMT family class I SAM-dependent methyltransferase [Flavobacterium]UOK42416.1 TPMT family class I SAM-dependent methyltransferase [Flavobacterium enshiense]
MKNQLNSEYWENRYQTNQTGWDAGSVTTPLKEYIDQIKDKNLKILIPGAGNGYELDYFLSKGFKNVFVADFAESPLQNIKKRIPEFPDSQLLQTDFFVLEGKFDLIMEQTFFCALSPELRKNYVTKMHSLLSDKGKLFGLLFDFPLTEDGPPFGGSKEEYTNLFSELFNIKTLETAHNSIQPRKARELFFIVTPK